MKLYILSLNIAKHEQLNVFAIGKFKLYILQILIKLIRGLLFLTTFLQLKWYYENVLQNKSLKN